jgi:hypothetical protein
MDGRQHMAAAAEAIFLSIRWKRSLLFRLTGRDYRKGDISTFGGRKLTRRL